VIECAYCPAPAVVHLVAGWREEYTCELCVGEAQRHLEGHDDSTPVEMDWCA
jgi:hypothetical protein